MKYLCLVYLDEKRLDELPDEDCVAYDTAIRESGHCIASEALESVQTATTVRVRNSKVAITDGPFAETKEQLMGIYIVDCDTHDEVIAATRQLRFDSGRFEIRPLVYFDPGVLPARIPE